MTMITPSYLGETIEYSSLHACRSTLEDPTHGGTGDAGDPLSNGDAVRMENQTRQLNGEPLRTGHDAPKDVTLDGMPY